MAAGTAKTVIRSGWIVLSEFLDFVRRPHLNADREKANFAQQFFTGIWLFGLSLVSTALFAIFALPLLIFTNLAPSEKLSETLDGSAVLIIMSVVLLGPLIEELMFRGWLNGTLRALVASILSLGAIYLGPDLIISLLPLGAIERQAMILAASFAIIFCLSPIDQGTQIPGFKRVFPLIFYVQALFFGALHFQNYASTSLAIALFATLPLVICGLIWGYARLRLGIVAAFTLHAAYNVPAALGSIMMIHITA